MGSEGLELLALVEQEAKYNQLRSYRPYGHPDTLCPDGALWQFNHEIGNWWGWSNKPWQMDFHAAGKTHQERMLMAANRPGKTRSAAAEVAFHMTGRYPSWWQGKRFEKPVLVWTGSPTNETSRDIVQKELLGGTSKLQLGSGMVPRDAIKSRPKMRQAGVSDVVDQFWVNHVSGGHSSCVLKTYEQGWRKWQGTAPDIVWLDEEPDTSSEQKRIYMEALTRLLTSHGILMVTFTPLLGVTDLVEHFRTGGDGVWMETATWDDAPHLNPDERNRLAGSYPDHEREARMRGVPMMGEGRVFTIPEDQIRCSPFEIPPHFARLKGIDFGIDHPAAVVEIAWDRDKDIIYLTRAWKKQNADADEHCEAINHPDPWVPVAWPHDGANREKGSGKVLKDYYLAKQVRLLGVSARYSKDKGGSQPKEPIVLEIQDRCMSGGFKVFSGCTAFFDEYRNYHRKDGKLIDRKDDVLKALFYAVMMKRYAAAKSLRTVPMGLPTRPMVSM